MRNLNEELAKLYPADFAKLNTVGFFGGAQSITILDINRTGGLHYYHFDEASGNLIDFATSANGWTDGLDDDGSVTGASYGADGIIDDALSFDGVNDHILITDVGMPIDNEAFSYNFWINVPDFDSGDGFFAVGKNTTNQAFLFATANNDGTVEIGKWGGGILFSTAKLTLNNWHMITATSDGTTTKLYMDGAFDDSVLRTWDVTLSGDIHFGDFFGDIQDYIGKMDEVSLWSRKLTATEITNIYNNGKGVLLNPVAP